MVISRIIGGLGNQMFQYAVGFHLAKKLQTELKIDTSAFATYPLHRLSIGKFSISAATTNREDVAPFIGEHAISMYSTIRRILKFPIRKIPGYVREPKFTFNAEILELTGNTIYLDGYWQSEKYFSDVAEDIRNEFMVANTPDEQNRNMLDRIQSTESVCLHIRRGDYVKDQQTNNIHGTLPLTYYHHALEYLRTIRDSLTLFIFSDDLDWVRENFKTHFQMVFVDHNGPSQDYEDMRLMSTCKHHIIANSTFSWWGAWLGQHEGQIVVAPEKWFNSTKMNSTDLVPARWLRM